MAPRGRLHSLHLAQDDIRLPRTLRCLSCEQCFPERAVQVNARDDAACPHCGSLRLEEVARRSDGLRGFLLRYNQL